jgi:hypothetical protein
MIDEKGVDSKSLLKNDGALTPEDRGSWERFAETALVNLMNNQGFHEGRSSSELVKEAGLMADALLNMAVARFAPSKAPGDDLRDGNTGLFQIPAQAVGYGGKKS